jgi:urease accessory protein
MSSASPFAPSASKPGHGEIHLALLPPSTPVLRTVSYQYPLKLIAPLAVTISSREAGSKSSEGKETEHLVHTVFVLTYGGGLVAGDRIALHVTLDPDTRLVLLTQGSTKIFKSPDASVVSGQRMSVDLAPGSALCFLPDPVQPFEKSAFEQAQIYNLLPGERAASLCVLDWVCEGRSARDEKWQFWKYTSKNEVWLVPSSSSRGSGCDDGENKKSKIGKKLLLRDNVMLDTFSGQLSPEDISSRVDNLGVSGTLVLGGPLFESLGQYFLAEFKLLRRIGGRNWDGPAGHDGDLTEEAATRKARQQQEVKDGLLWTVSHVRGFVVVKVGSPEVEGAKRFLRTMLKSEDTIEREFGERALFCLR